MNEMIKRDCTTAVTEAVKNANVNINLENWPCAVAVLGVCATVAFVEWLQVSLQEKTMQKVPVKVVKDAA